MNLLRSFGVFPVLKVAPLWVSVLHLHTSLPACKRDMSLPIPLPRLRNGDIPNPMLKSLWINHCMGIFMHDFLMIFHRSSFMPESQCLCEIYRFAFIPRLKSWAFCSDDRNLKYSGNQGCTLLCGKTVFGTRQFRICTPKQYEGKGVEKCRNSCDI